jgi:glyoxylase-like metal-dependent hydrolase (beta-lactamase superfamily II)
MFGVVPYPLWSRRVPPDDRMRIPLAMRCLLVEHPEGPVLIDTALGNKEDARFLDIYGVENGGLEGATQLEDALATAGFLPRDIRMVINTHLHFDHAGGNTTMDPELEDDPRRHVRPAFPNATYVVQRGELEFARTANERTRASYLPANFEPIAAAEPLAAAGGRRRGAPRDLGPAHPGARAVSTRRCWSRTAARRRRSSPT